MPLLSVRDLRVSLPFPGSETPVEVVRGVSFDMPEGGFHALVGESGCGKSMTAMALTRLPPTDSAVLSGEANFQGHNLLSLSPKELRAARREGGIAYIFQEPIPALDPVLSLGTQIRETGATAAEANELLMAVGLDPSVRRKYPCELSGGMAQRVCIAMALAQKPKLLVADEPTTALDVLVQRKVLDLLRSLCRARGVAVLLITHNLALVSTYAETMSVLYAGQVVEDGPVHDILAHPAHPYTAALLRAVPRLEGSKVEDLAVIPGRVPSPREWGSDPCVFRARCPYAADCDSPKARCTRSK